MRLEDGAEAARNTRAAATFVPLCVQAPSPAAGAQMRLSSDLHPRLNQRLLGCGHQDDRSEVEPRKEASSGGIPAAGAGAGNVLKTAAILPAVQDDLAGRRTCCPRGVIQRTITAPWPRPLLLRVLLLVRHSASVPQPICARPQRGLNVNKESWPSRGGRPRMAACGGKETMRLRGTVQILTCTPCRCSERAAVTTARD